MLPEFEQSLALGDGLSGLEKVRDRLSRQVEEDRQERLRQIENDFKTCQLIRFGLDQDTRSIGYAVARGIVRWYQRQYPDNDGQVAKDLMRDVRRSEYEKRQSKVKGANHNDAIENENRAAADTDDGTV